MTSYAVDHHEPKSERRRKQRSVMDADAVARFRFGCVQVFRAAEGTMRARIEAVAEAIRTGQIPCPPRVAGTPDEDLTPSRLSLTRWDKRAGTPPSMERLRDGARSGRPRLDWTPSMERALEQAAGTAQPLSVIVDQVQRAAREDGVTPPSENTVKRAYRRLPPEFRRIAVHGPHAAKAGALRHGAVSTSMPMEWLSLDFAELPMLVRAQGKTERGVVKPGVVLITDWFSGVIVGYQLVDPSLRQRTGSYVTEDVHAALCGVLYPEFAMPACAAYSGAMPMGVRFDRASMHREIHALGDYGVQIPNLPGYTPHRNGKVEAMHRVVKRLVEGLVGSTKRWRVVDTDALHRGTQTKKPATAYDASNLKRAEPERWRLPCRLDDLPTFAEFADTFDGIIAQINHEEIREGPAGGTTTRHHRFMAHRQLDRLRAGRDGWPLLEVLTCRVEARGIRVHQIGRMAAVTREGTPLAVGQTVTLRLHPLWNGAFVVFPEHHEFVQPHADWARGLNPAMLAYEHNKARRAARDRVEAAQDATLRDALGDGPAIAMREYETVEQQGKDADAPAASDDDARDQPAPSRSTQASASAPRSRTKRALSASAALSAPEPAPSAQTAQSLDLLERLKRARQSGGMRPLGGGSPPVARGPLRLIRRPLPPSSPLPEEHSA